MSRLVRAVAVTRLSLSAILLVIVSLLLGGCRIATIRPLDPVTGKPVIEVTDEQFDPATYVDRIWASRVLPYARQEAVPYSTLMEALRQDTAAASERYGHREGTRPYSFVVSGTGRVLELDRSSLMGMALIDVEPFDGVPDLKMQIGPVIGGTALRDALPFVSFGDVTNQVEFAAISRELHARVRSEVLDSVHMDGLVGREILFVGAFSLENLENITITPLIIEGRQ